MCPEMAFFKKQLARDLHPLTSPLFPILRVPPAGGGPSGRRTPPSSWFMTDKNRAAIELLFTSRCLLGVSLVTGHSQTVDAPSSIWTGLFFMENPDPSNVLVIY